MNKAKILKLAEFIERLPRRKLNMGYIARLNGSKQMDPHECNSAACAMGWAPAVFPRELKWTRDVAIISRKTGLRDLSAIAQVLDITDVRTGVSIDGTIQREDALYLFSSGRPLYHTPKQVAAGLREYAKTGILPERCQ